MKTVTRSLTRRCDNRIQCCRLHKNVWLLYLAAKEAEATLNELASPAHSGTITRFPALGQLRAVLDKIDNGELE